MTDNYGLREACNVAWLKFRREVGTLVNDANEEFIRIAFNWAFAEGWITGGRTATAANVASLNSIIEGVAKGGS